MLRILDIIMYKSINITMKSSEFSEHTRVGVGKPFSEGATLLCLNSERAGMCVRLLMCHAFCTPIV